MPLQFRLVGRSIVLGLGAIALVACETELEGLLPSPAGDDGPAVVFDLLARPLPEIPFPNDMATRFDLDAATGRRVNASLSAPTRLEEDVRNEFNHLDGWGTYAPITASFTADIDPIAIKQAHLDDDFANDAVYLVNLTTGEPTPLDFGRGNFPLTLQESDRYFSNDFRNRGSNMLFETYEEVDVNANGVLDPEEDTDHDGVWDKPNTIDPTKPMHAVNAPFSPAPAGEEGNDVYRDLVLHYERQTHTLIIRPVVPLEQRTTYAVVLTRRIKTPDGKPVRSPFPFVNHQAQTDQLRDLLKHIDGGKVPGLTKDDVAFTWAFTTQSVTTDMEAIRSGLYGEGTLARLATEFPHTLEPVQALYGNELKEHALYPVLSPDLADKNGKNPYVVPIPVIQGALEELPSNLLGDLSAIVTSFDDVSYIVFGSFKSPGFLDDPDKPTQDALFSLDALTGQARIFQRPSDWKEIEAEFLELQQRGTSDAKEVALAKRRTKQAIRDRITFFVAIPKTTAKFKPPFPYVIYGHGVTSAREEALPYAGYMAKFGMATVGMNSYAHGLDVDAETMQLLSGILESNGLAPMGRALFNTTRSRDLNNDGVEDSGADYWTANTFHTRDVVRQSITDWLQLIRVFKAFGTYDIGDLNGDGTPEKAGDFNGDGIVDVGGENGEVFLSGGSLGGILTGTAGALEPNIIAAAPIAGGGGLGDIAIRTDLNGTIDNVFSTVFGQVLVSQPTGDGKAHLALIGNDVGDTREYRVTGEPLDLQPGDRVEMVNLNPDNEEVSHDWAIVGEDRRFRLHVAADAAKFRDDAPVNYDAARYRTGPELDAFTDVHVRPGACETDSVKADMQARFLVQNGKPHADCFKFTVLRKDGSGEYKPVQEITETSATFMFMGRVFPAGSKLVALEKGFGFKRQSKTFRRFMSIAQTILEPCDPINYAQHYFKKPLDLRKDRPLAILLVPTGGDMGVPVNTGFAMARAAGVLPYKFDPVRDAAWGMSPNDVLIKTGAMEANEKLRYAKPLADHMGNGSGPLTPRQEELQRLLTCKTWGEGRNVCAEPSLPDVTNMACAEGGTDCWDDTNGYMKGFNGVPRLKVPLREAVTTAPYASTTWSGEPTQVVSTLVLPYGDAAGRHGFDLPNADAPWDIGTYMVNMMGYFFYARGTQVKYERCLHRDGWTHAPGHPDRAWDPACDFLPFKPTGD